MTGEIVCGMIVGSGAVGAAIVIGGEFLIRVVGIVEELFKRGTVVVMGCVVGREDEVVGRNGVVGVGGVPVLTEGGPGEHLIGRQAGMAADGDLHGASGVGIVEGVGQVVEAAEVGDLALGMEDDLEIAGADSG